MKFKVGDKVKIKNKGTICTVHEAGCSIAGRKGYKLYMNGFVHPSTWWDEELELVEAKPFTKSDLKDGMVIEHRDGDRYMAIGGFGVSEDGNWELDRYYEDLRWDGDSAYDIMKVYKVKPNIYMDLTDTLKTSYLTLIWERKEEPENTEMTVEEIEKKLGYKVKVVADK